MFNFFGKLFTKEAAKQTTKQITKQTVKQTTKQAAKQATKQFTKQTAKKLGKESAESGIKIGLKQGAKVLAKNGDDIAYPLIKRASFETAEHAVTNPKIMQKLIVNFGDDATLKIIKRVPQSEMPMFLRYIDKADSQATKKLFLECYQKEGADIFKRITPSMIFATGLTASMLYGTHRATTPMVSAAETIGREPDVADKFVENSGKVIVSTFSRPILIITIVLCVLVLNKFGIFGQLYRFISSCFTKKTDCFEEIVSKERIKPIVPEVYESSPDENN